jgi:hypothetical protein
MKRVIRVTDLLFAGKLRVGTRGTFIHRNSQGFVTITRSWPDRTRFTFDAEYKGRQWRGTGRGDQITLREVQA